MITRKGFWLLASILTVVAPSALFGAQNSLLLGLTALLWFAYSWGKFAVECLFVLPRLRVLRTVSGQPTGRSAVNEGGTLSLHVELRSEIDQEISYLHIADLIPTGTIVLGETSVTGSCHASRPLAIDYTLQTTVAGILRFEGLRIDYRERHGLFRHRRFLRCVEQVAVLPTLALERDSSPIVKQRNVLPIQGIHRHKRPGSGTELLDLRDYIEGDPPKNIAWKVSARRDRLITKEYESEVPVRCTFFFDSSDSMKVGPARSAPIHQASGIVASLARQLIAHRDPVGLCVFDAHGAEILPPAASNRQLGQIRHRLAEAIARPVQPKPMPPQLPFDSAYRLAAEVYPELLATAHWKGPWWKRFSILSLPKQGYLVVLVILLGLFLTSLVTPELGEGRILLIMSALIGLFGLAIYSVYRWFKRKRATATMNYSRRRRLATVLTAWADADVGTAPLLLADDTALSLMCQRFCNAHQVPIPMPLYGPVGEYLWKQPQKLEVLAKYLLNAASRGKDNELFVLCVDLLEVADEAKSLLRAVKVVQARHHQVIVICPWPAGVPQPDTPEWIAGAKLEMDPRQALFRDPMTTLYAFEFHRYRLAYEHLKSQLRRARVPLVCAASGDSVRQILDRVESLRSGRTRVTARYGENPR